MESTTESMEMQLPFPHGIEVELQVIRKDGTWIRGENILKVFDKIVSSAKNLMDKKIRTSTVESVKRKYKQSAQTEEGERGSRIVAAYEGPNGEPKEYTLLGHDPNVTSLTWILEVATPPCTTLEELAWWIQTLIAISQESLPKDSKAILVSTGLNPTQEYLRNLSFGEHHHILSPSVDEKTKIAVYNMIRNFLPHLIAISVNSPFENKKPTDEVTVTDDGKVRAPRCKRSIRLFKNTTQMGPTNEFELIPYLSGTDKEAFARHVNRSYARMVDMYPFTDYGTIEIRVFDTQLSIPRRMGLALILQALALKAKRMVESGETIPDVGPNSLAANRESAVAAGLWGPFKASSTTKESEYVKIYNSQITDDGRLSEKKNRFLSDAVASMFYMIRNELEELNIIENPFMQALLVSVFGSEFSDPKTTGSDFQLEVYAKSDNNMVVLLKKLAEVTRECSTNWLYDPIEGTPHLPTWICWWKGLEPEIVTDMERVFAGQEVQFSILVKNSTGRQLEDLTVSYTIEDSERNLVETNVLSIPTIENGEIHVSDVSFATRKNIAAYNIIAEVGFAGRVINLSSTINMYWMRVFIKAGTTTQFADGKTPVMFTGQIETNYPTKAIVKSQVSVISPNIGGVLAMSEDTLEIKSGESTDLNHSQFTPILVPPDASTGVERCLLQLRLLNEDGTEIADAVSKPFYVGFVKRGPQVILDVDLKNMYVPGDLITGNIIASNLGKKAVSDDARISLEFKSDSGRAHLIEEFLRHEFVDGEVRFRWKIPLMSTESPADRVGILKASLVDKGKEIGKAESDRFRVDQITTRVNIDSLRVPKRSHVGGKLSGWLRIRRNTETGEQAVLTMSFIYPNGDEHRVLSQSVKQSKNLSLAFGPVTVPAPRSDFEPRSVSLVASLSYAGIEVDSRTAEIGLFGGPEADIADIAFVGLPSFASPDEVIQPSVQITSNLDKKSDCVLTVELESVGGNKSVMTREIELEPGQQRILPIPVRVPMSAEMSTAHLRATLRCGKQACENRQRFKIKAIDGALFKVSFSVLDESGEEIPGLVARLTPIDIVGSIESNRENIEDLALNIRIMTVRDLVKEFTIPIPKPESRQNIIKIKWMTPPIDVVTAFYIDAVMVQGGRPLPARAVDIVKRQFTVY
ncbi:MAG: glutamate-cysteine ligase family protein [Candidatus Thorarchaeota archaeon]